MFLPVVLASVAASAANPTVVAPPPAPAAKPRRVCRTESLIGSNAPKRVCVTLPPRDDSTAQKGAQGSAGAQQPAAAGAGDGN